MASRIHPLISVEDLECMPDDGKRYEVIEGELFVSTAPSIRHQRTVQQFQYAFLTFLRAHPVGILVPGAGVVFSDYDGVIPDLVFVRQDRWDAIVTGGRFTGAPDLVIEVLSPGSENARRDRIVKPQLYSRFSVAEYWIADPEERTIEQYQLGEQGLELVATYSDADELTSPLLPGFRLKVAEVFNV